MSLSRDWRVTSAIACLGVLAACGDSTAPKVTAVDNLLAESDGAWMPSGAAALTFSNLAPAATTRPYASTCTYNASTTFFDCPSRTNRGLTFKLSYQLLDAANKAMTAFDAQATAAIRSVSDVSGTMTFAENGLSGALTIAGHTDRVLGGLLATNQQLDGTGTTSMTLSGFSGRGSGQTDPVTITTVETITALVLPPRATTGSYPLSGSITSQLFEGVPVAGATPTFTTTLTFNGTSVVTMTMTGFGGNPLTCTFDLKAPSSAPKCS